MTVQVIEGDCRAVLRSLPDASFHSCVTDPPYHLSKGKKGGKGPASANPGSPAGRARITTGFMGAAWDGGDVAADLDVWREVFRVLKPGAYLLAFGGTRTFHRMVCAIEDAGFEIRDCIRHEQAQETWPGWVYGSGFPKSHNVAKAIDKRMGARGVAIAAGSPVRRILPGAAQCRTGSWEKPEGTEYQPHAYVPATPEAQAWQGWGTALKPAWEPICVARKPLQGTVAANVLAHGCGALNIDASRVPAERATGWGGGGAGAGTWNPETCRLKAGQPRPWPLARQPGARRVGRRGGGVSGKGRRRGAGSRHQGQHVQRRPGLWRARPRARRVPRRFRIGRAVLLQREGEQARPRRFQPSHGQAARPHALSRAPGDAARRARA